MISVIKKRELFRSRSLVLDLVASGREKGESELVCGGRLDLVRSLVVFEVSYLMMAAMSSNLEIELLKAVEKRSERVFLGIVASVVISW